MKESYLEVVKRIAYQHFDSYGDFCREFQGCEHRRAIDDAATYGSDAAMPKNRGATAKGYKGKRGTNGSKRI